MALADAIETAPATPPAMTAPTTASAPNPPRRGWLTALMALRRLLADKEDTGQVFEIFRALNGKANQRNYARLISSPEGGRIAYEHVELAPLLMDDAWLDSFADATVGAAYRRFIRSENISAEGLAEVSRQGQGVTLEQPHPLAWFGRRGRDSHDIWHVLTGYGRDGLGEACLVAFSYAQTRALGWLVIAIGAGLRSRSNRGAVIAAIWQGYQRGKACRWLPGEDYVRLMREPLEAARARLGLTAPTAYLAIPADMREPEPTGA